MSLHTSFLRVISHHGALQAGYTSTSTKVNSTTAPRTRSCSPAVNAMRVPEATCTGIATGDDRNSSIINHEALETLPMATTPATPAVYQVNLLAPPSPTTTGERGLPRFHAGDEVPYNARDSFARQLKPIGEAQLVPFRLIILHLPHLHHVATERNDKPTAYSYR